MDNKDTQSRVKPTDAASILIYRAQANVVEVLMGKRPVKSSFMPSVFVFPGGAVDRADSSISCSTRLNALFAAQMAVGNKQSRAHTIACAAIRETFEETGIIIARSGSIGKSTSPSWAEFHALNEAPDLSILSYLGRAITPPPGPKRFHARFFACDYTQISSKSRQVLRGNGELEELHWVSLNLTDPDMHTELPTRSVTRYMLTQLREMILSPDKEWMGCTLYSGRKGKTIIQNKSN